ncbi:SDR family NAD(P)-dependent oxidoreductase [Parafrankia sp. FMc6]|uniref:SDR family NAD(P)-dependent oxidoreductase n=1 Tax=Parafrankia soli TaxID=2599596 RepID=UPI0034D59D09
MPCRETCSTPGGSSGIGRATVRHFARNGDIVWFTYASGRERTAAILAEIRRENGADVHAFEFHQSDRESHRKLAEVLPGPPGAFGADGPPRRGRRAPAVRLPAAGRWPGAPGAGGSPPEANRPEGGDDAPSSTPSHPAGARFVSRTDVPPAGRGRSPARTFSKRGTRRQ